MLYVDILVIGSGPTGSLITKYLIKERIRKVCTIDPSGIWGGVHFSNTKLCNILVDKIPIFIKYDEKTMIEEEFETSLSCNYLKPVLIKENDVHKKMLSNYEIKDFQRPWFLEWKGKLCLMHKTLKDYIMIKNLKPIPSTVRILDLRKSIVVLRSNAVIKYKYLIWAAPLPELIKCLKNVPSNFNSFLRRFKWISSHIVILGLEGKKPEWTLAYHGTRATRAHTFVVKSYNNNYILYAIANFSDKEKAIPGFTEKLISDIKRLQIVPSPFKIKDEKTFTMKYSVLSKISFKDLESLKSEIESKNILLVGRSALWKELSIGDTIREAKEVLKKVINFI